MKCGQLLGAAVALVVTVFVALMVTEWDLR